MSDAHFGSDSAEVEKARYERVSSFFDYLAKHARQLFILGDFFDFWFEYKHVVPRRNLPGIFLLQKLVAAGVRVTYLMGNHEWPPGRILQNTLGIQVVRSPHLITLGEKQIHLEHGDGRIHMEKGYRLTRLVLKNRINMWLFRWLHPDLGVPLALRLSRNSRKRQVPAKGQISRYLDKYLKARFSEGVDTVIFGHDHMPLEQQFGDDHTYINLGDWVGHFSYACWEDNVVKLKLWQK